VQGPLHGVVFNTWQISISLEWSQSEQCIVKITILNMHVRYWIKFTVVCLHVYQVWFHYCEFKHLIWSYCILFFSWLVSGRNSLNPTIWLVPGVGGNFLFCPLTERFRSASSLCDKIELPYSKKKINNIYIFLLVIFFSLFFTYLEYDYRYILGNYMHCTDKSFIHFQSVLIQLA